MCIRDKSKTLPKSFEPMSDTAIKAGDFLFSRANTLELVGAVVLVRNDHPNLFLSDKILRLDLDPALKPWLLKYLQSLEGKRKLAAVSTGNQASMRTVSYTHLDVYKRQFVCGRFSRLARTSWKWGMERVVCQSTSQPIIQ